MPARGNALRRRVRSTGGKLLRRLRLLPGGMPDGIGDDAALQDATLEGEVVVYFPDTTASTSCAAGTGPCASCIAPRA